MIKEKLNRNTIFYKLYLYYQLFFRYKLFYKKKNYSQFKEDEFIINYFINKKKGKFVDLGAYHPMRYNNTYLLYKKGWVGTNIDLNQTSIDMFNIVRKKDKNICALLSSNKNEMKKVYYEHNFSAVNTVNPTNKNIQILKIVQLVKTRTFNQLIKNQFDFLNIDLEGHDYQVLKTINLNKFKPKLICIEISKNKEKIFLYLKKNNYNFLKKNKISFFFERQK